MERVINKKILVISDDPVLQGLLSSSISGESYSAIDARDAFEELEATLDRTRPDLIFLDAGMPQLDGIEMCLRLRCLYDIPIIMLAAWRTECGAVRGLDFGNDFCLTEPLTIPDLVTQVEETLERNSHCEHSSHMVGCNGFGLLRGMPLSIQYMAAG